MIHRAKFQNFKALRDVEVTFDSRLTVLVGPNGSGKTSVLRGLRWLCDLVSADPSPQTAAGEVQRNIKQTYSGLRGHQLFEIAERSGNGDMGVRMKIHPDSPNPTLEVFVGSTMVKRDSPLLAITFAPAELIQLEPTKLSAPSLTTVTPPRMGVDGAGIASLMAYFKLYDEPRYEQVVELFQRVIPQVQKVRVDRVPAAAQRGTMGEGLVFDLPGRKGAPASAMSDGTLYALGLIVKILDPQRPKTLLIDDIDHGFHPKAQLTLVELLHKLLDEIPDLQIIATSHSPYILDRLKWNEVRVSSLRDDGSAVIARLEDHPDFDRWKDAMSPGEFWSTFYEEWATKTKPALQPVS